MLVNGLSFGPVEPGVSTADEIFETLLRHRPRSISREPLLSMQSGYPMLPQRESREGGRGKAGHRRRVGNGNAPGDRDLLGDRTDRVEPHPTAPLEDLGGDYFLNREWPERLTR